MMRTAGGATLVAAFQSPFKHGIPPLPVPLLFASRPPFRSIASAIPRRSLSFSCRAFSRGASIPDLVESERENKYKEEEKGISQPDRWTIKMLYDGECPLCLREVNMLRERNRKYGTIKFVDICADEYSADENAGIDFEVAMGRIHAILRDGTVLTNLAAFKKIYEELELGWVYSLTKYQPIARVADVAYSIWAKYRLALTGRPSLDVILEERKSKMAARSCDKEQRCHLK